MDFEPINDDHAIQSVTFVYALGFPLGPGVSVLEKAHNQIRRDLPAQTRPQPTNLAMNSPFPIPIGSQAIEFSYFRPDGTAIWTLRAVGQEIVVETTRYLRWEKSWKKAKQFLDFTISQIAIAEPTNSILATALRVVDRFRALKPDYSLATLLKPNDALPSFAWKYGQLWHNHSGWFDNANNDPVLHTLNFDARREGNISDRGELENTVFLNISHTQQTRFTPNALGPISELDGFQERLENTMHAMHASNKDLAQSLFTVEVCERIGLGTTL